MTTLRLSDLEKQLTNEFFSGKLTQSHFCAKSNDEYRLFARNYSTGLGSPTEPKRPATNSIKGCIINDDLTRGKKFSISEKANFMKSGLECIHKL